MVAFADNSVCTPKSAYPRFRDAILSTKYFDDETGLVYYGLRYYTPELGRWVNRKAPPLVPGVLQRKRIVVANEYSTAARDVRIVDIQSVAWRDGLRGYVDCDLTRIGPVIDPPMLIRNNNQGCTRECTQRHEEVHIRDNGDCCSRARRAVQAVIALGEPLDMRLIGDLIALWDAYVAEGYAWTECNAYTESYLCAWELRDRNFCCYAPTAWIIEGSSVIGIDQVAIGGLDLDCCDEILRYYESASNGMDAWCDSSNTRPRCPFQGVITLPSGAASP